MGCAIALEFAKYNENKTTNKYKINKIVLYSPFVRLKHIINNCVGPLCNLISNGNDWDNLENIKKINKDTFVYIFHGTQDKLIPISDSEKLRETRPNKTELYKIREAFHDSIKPSVTMLMFIKKEMEDVKNKIYYS